MKTNTMILAVLLFISVLGNILLIINPENVSKVHNLTSMHTSNATSHEKTTTISENIFEITDIEIIKDKYRGILPSIDVVLIHFSCKNMTKTMQTFYMDYLYLEDEDGNVYKHTYDIAFTGNTYKQFFDLEINPSFIEKGLGAIYKIPDPNKHYILKGVEGIKVQAKSKTKHSNMPK